MALSFKAKNVASAKLRETNKKTFITTQGVTPDETDPNVYATQINKMLAIGNKSVVADKNMSVTQIKEVVESE